MYDPPYSLKPKKVSGRESGDPLNRCVFVVGSSLLPFLLFFFFFFFFFFKKDNTIGLECVVCGRML
jgi:hypothetical protein